MTRIGAPEEAPTQPPPPKRSTESDDSRTFPPYCAIDDEAHIVWPGAVTPQTAGDYVREAVAVVGGRTTPPRWRAGELVAYATLRASARSDQGSGYYVRRIWWRANDDRAMQPDGLYSWTCPAEAVDPLTIQARHPSRLTARAWYGKRAS